MPLKLELPHSWVHLAHASFIAAGQIQLSQCFYCLALIRVHNMFPASFQKQCMYCMDCFLQDKVVVDPELQGCKME